MPPKDNAPPDDPALPGYDGPVGGWGSAESIREDLFGEGGSLKAAPILWKQNKPDGFMCVSCAWTKPADHNPFEFCENGAKATIWELTDQRCTPEIMAEHTLTELRGWTDHDIESLGRLTEPMRYDAATDRYARIDWPTAFGLIGDALKAVQARDPDRAVFYTSGRAALETSYMFQLFARLYGTNNLPDSSNMCHETTSVALPKSIGSPVGTVLLDDFTKTDLILFLGQNVGTNAPRMLHELQEARRRDVPIIAFNPLRERGLERFINPQSPFEMLTGSETQISTQYHQLRPGGDIAALLGVAKALFALDAADPGLAIIDRAFIAEHTQGIEAFEAKVHATGWDEIEAASGLARGELESTAASYAKATAVIAVYGMGLTQHRHGVETVATLVDLLLLRGNIGKPGAGICPVRGHSNVQGQRTVGITEKPELAPLDKLAALYDFEPPRKTGLATVDVLEAVLAGAVEAFVGLGGNFLRAVPDSVRMEAAWRRIGLAAHVATKLNRGHLVPAGETILLPCLGRIEIDRQASGPQTVSTEDSTTCIHGSQGQAEPASPHLLSEPAIVAGIAKATLAAKPQVPWDEWVSDYSLIRDAIETTFPDQFPGYNTRLFTPGGVARPVPARGRVWKTPSGKAQFVVPSVLEADGFASLALSEPPLSLVTLRSNDQFNTTVYGYDDRLRGIRNARDVLMMSAADMARFGVGEGEQVSLVGAVNDGVARRVDRLRVVRYDLPEGCIAGYFPELNTLIPVSHHALESKVPAGKSVPVYVRLGEDPSATTRR